VKLVKAQVKSPEMQMWESIEYYRQQGYVDGQIATILKEKGYDEEMVDQALTKPRNKFDAPALLPKSRQLDVQGLIVTFIIFALCAVAIIVIGGTLFGGAMGDMYMRQFSNYIGNFGVRPS
jgi:hypothetical protein